MPAWPPAALAGANRYGSLGARQPAPSTDPIAMPTSPARPAIHIFNGFQNPYGGSEQEALSLYALLKDRADVRLWATSSKAARELMRQLPIRRVARRAGAFPDGGTYVFVGAHWRNKLWPYFVRKPRRLIYLYNTFHPKVVALTSSMPRLLGWPRTEYVLISAFQSRLSNLPGEVHPSPIDIERFHPAPHPPHPRIVIGRMSRDVPEKHHPDDIALYRELAHKGHALRLQGASCLADRLAAADGIELTPEGAMPAADFLQSLDIFYYRSHTHVETFGRVVFEAMACALPVVCHAHGGYADAIRHGENGFLFETTDEARKLLEQLAADAALRARLGAAARETIEELYSAAAQEERLGFYLR
jgi:glycosyltransferase involved in cell wall biosynthesis